MTRFELFLWTAMLVLWIAFELRLRALIRRISKQYGVRVLRFKIDLRNWEFRHAYLDPSSNPTDEAINTFNKEFVMLQLKGCVWLVIIALAILLWAVVPTLWRR